MSDTLFKKDFIDKYNAVGEEKFYKFLLTYAINKLIKIRDGEYKGTSSPELEFLEHSEKFLLLSRREGDDVYLGISRVFRKAAHKIYRMMLKKNMTVRNIKFLNLV